MAGIMISGGNIQDEFALDFLNNIEKSYLIALDKGLEFCYRHELIPDIIAGDFDSADEKMLCFYKDKGIQIVKYNPIKDETDLELGLRIAADLNKTQNDKKVYLLGGSGTRIDHMIATIHAMNGMRHELQCILVDANNRLCILNPGKYMLHKKMCFGKYISFLPLGGKATGITLQGFKYDVDHIDMECSNSLGVSNEIRTETATISFDGGILLMIESKD